MSYFHETQLKKKQTFAAFVVANKDLLFGSYDDGRNIMHQRGERLKWIEVNASLESMGIKLFPEGRDWTYLRDTTWRNMVEPMKKKAERKKQTRGRIKWSSTDWIK